MLEAAEVLGNDIDIHVDDKNDKNVESEQNLGKNEPPVKSEEESVGVFLRSAAEALCQAC